MKGQDTLDTNCNSGNSCLLELVKFLSLLGWSNSGAGAQRGGISVFGNTQNPAGRRPKQLNLVKVCFEQEVGEDDL